MIRGLRRLSRHRGRNGGMARVSRSPLIRGVIFHGRIAWEGRFSQILVAANDRTATAEIDDVLEAIAAGLAPVLPRDSTMTAWTFVTLRNLAAYVRAGALSLQRCPECRRWFLAVKKTQHTCARSVCRTAYKMAEARRRARRSREIERG